MGAQESPAGRMTRVDTNVLVRFFVEDDQAQTDRIRHFLEKSRAAGEKTILPIISSVN